MKRSSALSSALSASNPSTRTLLDPLESSMEAFGQYEKITTRLNRLLDQYTDGFAVLKELVQNADDAGATEVRFLYDERANKDAMTHLLDEGMKECQGPALWVYNDAQFTDEDFENIGKLSGATKWQETEKIGKFGLGFSAVYNLTDVPIFLSRNYFVVFDPHMSHLGKIIKNPVKPGVKIDLNLNHGLLKEHYIGQFKPFHGIFGCDLSLSKEDNSFHGTLFRLPLRTREQAQRSEIKQLHYNDREMRRLLRMFIKGAENLLLFTQNTIRVGIYNLPCASPPNKPLLLFQVTKSLSPFGIQRELPSYVTLPTAAEKLGKEEKRLLRSSNLLQAASKFMKDLKLRKADVADSPRSTITINIDCNLTKEGSEIFGGDLRFGQKNTIWLVASSLGRGEAMRFIMDHNDVSLVPSAGVAVQLIPRELNKFLPLPVVKNVDGEDVNGSVFCYLPLPIHSGLPVHINGAFAVSSDRRYLQQKLEGEKSCYGVKWNEVLMKDSVSCALLELLDDLKDLVPHGDSYKFHLLWPTTSKVQQDCRPLMKSFYEQAGGERYSLFSDGQRWANFEEVVFLDPDFRVEEGVGETSFKVLQLLYGLNQNIMVVDLSLEIMMSFEKSGMKKEIASRKISKNGFFQKCFFPHLSRLPPDMRDLLMLYALKNYRNFETLIKKYACIPVSPSRMTLKCPGQLVNPKGEAAALFSPDEERFPFGHETSYGSSEILATLEKLGMSSDDLPWSEVAERAESIHLLNVRDCIEALKRVTSLLYLMEKKLADEKKKPRKFKGGKHQISLEIRRRLTKAKFVPVLKRPTSFPLRWKGDEFQGTPQVLVTPEEVFLKEEMYKVCCTEPLAGVDIPKNVKECLELTGKVVTWRHVIHQLQSAVSTEVNALNDTQYGKLSLVCTEAYAFLEKEIQLNDDELVKCLRGRSIILVGKRFLSPQQMAFELKVDCAPYLYKVPEQLADSFPKVLKVTGVKERFDESDYISGLGKLKMRFGEGKLDTKGLQVAVHMAVQLGYEMIAHGTNPSEVQEKWGTVHLPDAKGVMRPVNDLCIRDCPWIPDDDSVKFANYRLDLQTCLQIGVKTRREEVLQHHAIGIPCGQKEKLTNRLKRILTEYPCEKEILKELLQNADDAQATEISFIKDARFHPREKVFEDSWQHLQGPALCVHNNKPFNKEDIAGIQNLGEGSKGGDPDKTGQYGIGFNAVYHLTDVPSFISKGGDVGNVLVVFDPNCKYVPGASLSEPGRMYNVRTEIQSVFPDVLRCYLGELQRFSGGTATMFRFPLRTEEMAEKSNISSASVSLQQLDKMMKELKNELFEVLLFVDNVKKVTLCEVDGSSGNSKVENDYTVEASMSRKDEVNRKEFANYVSQCGNRVRSGELLPTDIPLKEVSYMLSITDNRRDNEKWLIVQQIGFRKAVSTSIIDACKKHQLGMLPRGGVACLLEKNGSTPALNRRKKVFCFLPLPQSTNLPVHVNGHFALDHESRRDLRRVEAGYGGYLCDWNNALFDDVVASCYVKMLVEVRNYYKLPDVPDIGVPSACTYDEMLQRITQFESLFPIESTTDQYWKTLIDSVYQEIDGKELEILPVVRKKDYNGISVFGIEWFPPTGLGKKLAFFNNLETAGPFARSYLETIDEKRTRERKVFEEILLGSGFNLVAFSLALHESFRRSGVPTCTIDPNSVINFFKTDSSQGSSCIIGPIPCDVGRTVFKSADGVVLVLMYCKGKQNFVEGLSSLPLLLTQDNYLDTFSCRNPKCQPRFLDLLPGSHHIFVHEKVYRKIFSGFGNLNSPMIKDLDADTFAANLPRTLRYKLYGMARTIKWSPDRKVPPSQRWINEVWDFLYELVEDVICNEEVDEDSKRSTITAALRPLLHWSILPVTVTKSLPRITFRSLSSTPQSEKEVEYLLMPLVKATAVLDLQNLDASNMELAEVLRKLRIPELDSAVFSSSSSRSTLKLSSRSRSLALKLVSSLKDPSSLLKSLDHAMTLDPKSATDRLQPSECKSILEYFSKSVSFLSDVDRRTLRRIPLYQATSGDFVCLDDARVCVLPTEIPREEIEVLERKLEIVFVNSWPSLSELFTFLSFECISAVDVYCTFILPSLSLLSKQARHSHLEYLRKSIVGDATTDKGDIQRLLNCLRSTPLLPSTDGILQTASYFYDPDIELFRVMLQENNFPSEPYRSSEWITFLREVGLVCEVSMSDFVRFAKNVALEASAQQTVNTYKKSEALVRHLMSRHNVVKGGLLSAIRDIAFIAADPVPESLQALPPFYGETEENQIPFIKFKGAVLPLYEEIVWTQAHLLPKWADPMQRLNEFHPPTHVSLDKYCKAFLSELQIVIKPAVDLVVRHCKVICLHLGNHRKGNCTKIRQVMEKIYNFLQENAMGSGQSKIALEATPCILVENGKRFIKPSQVVLELLEDDEIKPFLYRVPPEFGRFQPFFQDIGCCRSAECTHYAMVLYMLRETRRDASLNENELRMCFKAVKGFLERFQENSKDVSSLFEWYLPAVPSPVCCLESSLDAIPVTLRKSTELLFNDAPVYDDRIQRFQEPFVLDLKLMDVKIKSAMTNFQELMMRLPTHLQPKMLSIEVKEEITAGCREACEAIDVLMQQITSADFARGIIRIIKHTNAQNKEFDVEKITEIQTGLKSIQICAVSSLKTALFYRDDLIPGSEIQANSFYKKGEGSGEDKNTVYINVETGVDDTDVATSLVSDVIVDKYGELLGKSTYLVPSMLRCAPNKIWTLLDQMRIRQDDTCDVGETDLLPEPGTFISVEDHHLLGDAVWDFKPGEYVGYQLHDPSLSLDEGTPTFIFAVINAKVMPVGVPCKDDWTLQLLTMDDWALQLLTRIYSINIGRDKGPVNVPAAKLYKLLRPQETSETQGERCIQRSEDARKRVICLISTILESAWNCELIGDDRTQLVKRLVLHWLPENNLGDEEFCAEVSEHIKQELSRLGGSYEKLMDLWVKLAKGHRSKSEAYQIQITQQQDSQGVQEPWKHIPLIFSRRYPHPEEAERWLRQAEADLAAGRNDIDSTIPSHQWACYKFHQAAEKALKAAHYASGEDKTSLHDLVRNCHSLDDNELTSLARELESLVGNSARMRYPDRMKCPLIPNDVYSSVHAQEALLLATSIVTRVKEKIIQEDRK